VGTVTVLVVAVVIPELYRLYEPTPVVPRFSSYAVIALPGVHVKVTLEPVNVLPGVGVVRAAGRATVKVVVFLVSVLPALSTLQYLTEWLPPVETVKGAE
jgi:hypothetical protein